jgi:hypothetical protein
MSALVQTKEKTLNIPESLPSSDSNAINGLPKPPAETLSSAQTPTETASWGDWFMGILNSLLGWLFCCCSEKKSEVEKPVFINDALNDFYMHVKNSKNTDGSEKYTGKQLGEYLNGQKAKWDALSPAIQNKLLKQNVILEQALKAEKAEDWPWVSEIVQTKPEKFSSSLLPIKWVGHKAQWRFFYQSSLQGNNPLSNKQLRSNFYTLSEASQEAFWEIAEKLGFKMIVSTLLDSEDLAEGSNLQTNEFLINFFKFLIDLDYNPSILMQSQMKVNKE